MDDARLVQVIAPALDVPLDVEDLRTLAETERDAEARRIAQAERRARFDLAQGPLLRARLLCLRDGEHWLLLTMHHIVTDGWSVGVLWRELAVLYAAFRAGQPSPLPALAVQYADYAVWQREWLQGEALERQLAYWQRHAGGTAAAGAADRPAAAGDGEPSRRRRRRSRCRRRSRAPVRGARPARAARRCS